MGWIAAHFRAQFDLQIRFEDAKNLKLDAIWRFTDSRNAFQTVFPAWGATGEPRNVTEEIA